MEKLINETILSAYEYLANGCAVLKILAEEFYQHPEDSTWKKLSDLFEGIQWIIETIAQIEQVNNLDQIITNYIVWNEYVQTVAELNGCILQLEEAMVNKDSVLIGDILSYEILPIFEKMHDKLRFLIPRAVNVDVS